MDMYAGVPVLSARGKPKRLDHIRDFPRVKHYGLHTEKAYPHWTRRFILFHGQCHPSKLGRAKKKTGIFSGQR